VGKLLNVSLMNREASIVGDVDNVVMDTSTRYREVRKVTLVGSAIDLLLGVLKLTVGSLASSQALIADGVHSLSDLATDIMVLIAAKHSHHGADADHPYGHERFETAATVGLGVSLIIVAIGIASDSFHRLLNPERLLQPEWIALAVAGLSVVCKEAIYHYTMHVARKVRSAMLRANAWHSRSDALSSIAVIVGVTGALLGYKFVDTIAAIVVSIMVGHVGWRLTSTSLQELVDTGLEADQVKKLRDIILSIDGVDTLHLLRTRQLGGRTFADVHIILNDPRVSVSEGHQISETVRTKLIRHADDVVDVTVHIDPEDDEANVPNKLLPLRNIVLAELEQRWAVLPVFEHIGATRLHYLAGRIEVEVQLPIEWASSGGPSVDPHGIESALSDLNYLSAVTVLYRI
jgi:cation diffusion facilitator family transporter